MILKNWSNIKYLAFLYKSTINNGLSEMYRYIFIPFFSQRFRVVDIALLLPFLQQAGLREYLPKVTQEASMAKSLDQSLCCKFQYSIHLTKELKDANFCINFAQKKYNLLLLQLIDYWFCPCYKFFNLHDLGYLKEIIDVTVQRYLKFIFLVFCNSNM